MKHNRVGIILAGGKGTRLYPLTKIISKQLLPVYNKPAIYHPIETLIQTGHQRIIIITKPEDKELFKELILTNKDWNCDFIFLIQEYPKGLPDAFYVAQDYIANKSSTLILGDNILKADFLKFDFTQEMGASIFVKEVDDPQKYGVVEIDNNNQILSLEEKPLKPRSNLIAIGLYLFDKHVIEKVNFLSPSQRRELEIFELINLYLKEDSLKIFKLDKNDFWFDIGNFDDLFRCSQYFYKKEKEKK